MQQPEHIRFKVRMPKNTINDDKIEGCNIRLTTINKTENGDEKIVPNQDVFIFRLGTFNYMKLNLEYMVKKVNNEQWYQVDLLIKWS